MPFAAAIPVGLKVAKIAGPLIMKAFGGWFGKKKKDAKNKEAMRVGKEQVDRKFQSDFDTFENNEDARQGQVQGYSEALQGNRALSPAVIAAAMKRRKNTAYKGSVEDKNKGEGFGLAENLVGSAADTLASYNKESAIDKAEQAAAGGPLAQASKVQTLPTGRSGLGMAPSFSGSSPLAGQYRDEDYG